LCEASCPFGAIRDPVARPPKKSLVPMRRRLVLSILATPIIMAALGLVGYVSGPTLATRDFTVRLAERIWNEEQGVVTDVSDESRAFRGSGGVPEQLYQLARRVRRNFTVGGSILGAFIGLVVGLKLVSAVIRRGRAGYTTDPGACLACARCYASCPVGKPVELTIGQDGKLEEEKELVAV
jgi:ferredoxin